MSSLMRLAAAIFLWWVIFLQHPTQPVYGPFYNVGTCLHAAHVIEHMDHEPTDCREIP